MSDTSKRIFDDRSPLPATAFAVVDFATTLVDVHRRHAVDRARHDLMCRLWRLCEVGALVFIELRGGGCARGILQAVHDGKVVVGGIEFEIDDVEIKWVQQ